MDLKKAPGYVHERQCFTNINEILSQQRIREGGGGHLSRELVSAGPWMNNLTPSEFPP